MSTQKVWRKRIDRYRLLGLKCKNCGNEIFPKRMVCPKCGGREFTEKQMPFTGKIVARTSVHIGAKFLEYDTPYQLAVVELDNGVCITAQVVDAKPEDVQIGKKVKIVYRKLQEEGKTGVIAYGYKAQLV